MKHFITLLIVAMICFVTMLDAQVPSEKLNEISIDSLKNASENQRKEMALKLSSADITSLIFHTEDKSYGYYIFIDGQMIIEQRSIPGKGGNSGFINEEDAKKVASLVISKLKSGEMPPSVSLEELKKLNLSTATE